MAVDKTGWNTSLNIKAKRISRVPLKALIVDYRDNMRSCLYKYKDKPCCFTPTEPAVVQRIASLLEHGQLTPIKVWRDARGRPHVSDGFLRVFCFHLLRDQRRLDEIPGAGPDGHVVVDCVRRPKSQEDYIARAKANLHDNMSKPLSPVDIAYVLRRLAEPIGAGGEYGLGRAEAGVVVAASIGRPLAKSTVDEYLRLLSLRPRVLAQVHLGEKKMSVALREASDNGEGVCRGPRSGVKVPFLRRVRSKMPDNSREAKFVDWFLDPENHEPPAAVAKAVAEAEKEAKKEAKTKAEKKAKTKAEKEAKVPKDAPKKKAPKKLPKKLPPKKKSPTTGRRAAQR